MAVITSGAHPAALWPGVHAFFGANYKKFPQRWSSIFTTVSSTKQYEEDIVTTGFGLAQVKSQGGSIAYDDHSQEGTKRYTHDTWGLGYIVTMEELQDNQYKSKSFRRSKMLARSMAITKEINGANILNRGFSSSYANGWDSKELFATDHATQGGNSSNELAVSADLSEASIEDLCIQIHQMEDSRGLNIMLQPRKLIVPVNLKFEAHRILKSTLQSGTANNDANALKDMGVIPEIVVNEYLTDADAWFIGTDADTGLQCMNRMGLAFTQDNDFDTENAKAKAVERYVFGWSDWRGAFGSPGA